MFQSSVLTGIIFIVLLSHKHNFCVSAQYFGRPANHGFKRPNLATTFDNGIKYSAENNDYSDNCLIPTFLDDAQFYVDECQGSSVHPLCQGQQSARVPKGWKGTLKCKNGASSTVKTSSICSSHGRWNPPFPQSCTELIQLYVKQFSDSSGYPQQQSNNHFVDKTTGETAEAIPCVKLHVAKDPRFIYSCLFPGYTDEVEDCGTEKLVDSGTQAFLRCKPPFFDKNGDGGGKKWVCKDGQWINSLGKSAANNVVCYHTSTTTPFNGQSTVLNNQRPNIQQQYRPLPQYTTQRPTAPQFVPTTQQYNKIPTIHTTVPPPTTTITTSVPISNYRQPVTVKQPEELPIDIRQSSGPESSIISFPYSQKINFTNPSTTSTPRAYLYTVPTSSPAPQRLITASSTKDIVQVTMCPPLRKNSPGLRIECIFRMNHVSTSTCEGPVPVGSQARYFCDEFYEATVGLTTFYRKCKDDGTWSGSSSQFACAVRCGASNVIRLPYITHGSPTVRGQYPWNAAVFTRTVTSERVNTEHSFICGGSLISHKAIITAAHCVTEYQSTVVRKNSTLRIEMGKYRLHDEDEFVQIRSVSKVLVHPSYSPYGYDSDIAIVIFDTPINITYHVRPVCYPQISDSAVEEFQLSENSLGTVAGWGKDENGKLSEQLHMTMLPVVSSRACLENVQDAFVTQLQTRSTTYCAGFKNGTNVCNGDSGSGMYFPSLKDSSTRWYLQGVVSVGIPDKEGNCDPTKYSIFTRVGRYADFIVRSLSEEDAN